MKLINKKLNQHYVYLSIKLKFNSELLFRNQNFGYRNHSKNLTNILQILKDKFQ